MQSSQVPGIQVLYEPRGVLMDCRWMGQTPSGQHTFGGTHGRGEGSTTRHLGHPLVQVRPMVGLGLVEGSVGVVGRVSPKAKSVRGYELEALLLID